MKRAVALTGLFAVASLLSLYAVGCAASSETTSADAWCCNLSASGWSCGADCTADYCPDGVTSQERCSPAVGEGGCTTWTCGGDADASDAGALVPAPPPPPFGQFGGGSDASMPDAPETGADQQVPDGTVADAPSEPTPDAGRDARSGDASAVDAVVTAMSLEASAADAGLAQPLVGGAGPCTPDGPCGGLSTCDVACWSSSYCMLSCACEDPYGGAGNPTDPSARLVCQATCP